MPAEAATNVDVFMVNNGRKRTVMDSGDQMHNSNSDKAQPLQTLGQSGGSFGRGLEEEVKLCWR